jgi:cellulose synthase/poly-beta-1,6-N-acetylglucosamine synthase-like glycosyltransferase
MDFTSIPPVPEGSRRPTWSVMIPTYNRSRYLAQALESVFSQGFDPDEMQIEVVDNCSTQSESEPIVRSIGSRQVSFYRQPKHVSMTANFNTCIQRARGRLVHILHDDDYVFAGFYQAFEQAFRKHPDIALVASRCFVVDAEGEIDSLTPRIRNWERPSKNLAPLYAQNPLRVPGVVVRRTSYEEFGGYMDFPYVPDWEMWARLVGSRGCLFLNHPLAAYRMYPQNQTSALQQTSDDLRDELRMAALWEGHGQMQAAENLRREVAKRALLRGKKFSVLGKDGGSDANMILFRETLRLLPFGIRLKLRVMEGSRIINEGMQSLRWRLKLRTRFKETVARLGR